MHGVSSSDGQMLAIQAAVPLNDASSPLPGRTFTISVTAVKLLPNKSDRFSVPRVTENHLVQNQLV
jgi:hypothetical protein